MNTAARGDRNDDGGFTVLWVLGLCVIVLFIGGISLDSWRGISERRALSAAAHAAASAGANGIDEDLYRQTGDLRLDPDRAEAIAYDNLARQLDTRSLTGVDVVASPERITVTIAGTVDLTLLRLLAPDGEPLTITVTADANPRLLP